MAISYQDKYLKVTEFFILNTEFKTLELMNELEAAIEVVSNLERQGIPAYALKAIAHALRFDLDFGGDSLSAKKMDILAQDLASQGFIQEPETIGEIEDFLVSLYQSDKNIKNLIQEAKDKLDYFYESYILHSNFKLTRKCFNNVFVLGFRFLFKFVFEIEAVEGIKVIFWYLVNYKSLVLDLSNQNPPSNKSP